MSGDIQLNRQLVLETAERVSDGSGGFVVEWLALGTLFARITARNGGESRIGGRDVWVNRLDVLVRTAPQGALSRPKPSQRFREGERIYGIESVTEAGLDGRFLLCRVIEGGGQ